MEHTLMRNVTREFGWLSSSVKQLIKGPSAIPVVPPLHVEAPGSLALSLPLSSEQICLNMQGSAPSVLQLILKILSWNPSAKRPKLSSWVKNKQQNWATCYSQKNKTSSELLTRSNWLYKSRTDKCECWQRPECSNFIRKAWILKGAQKGKF